MALILPNQISTLLPGLQVHFQNGFEGAPVVYPQLCTTVQSTSPVEVHAWTQRLPKMRKWVGSRVYNNMVASSQILENERYEHTVALTRSEFEDDKFGLVMPARAAGQGRAARRWPEDMLMTCIANGASTVLVHDGLPLFSQAHTMNPAGVQSNDIVVASGPDAAGFASVVAARAAYTGEDGTTLGMGTTHILVPKALENKARNTLNAAIIATGGTNILVNQAQILVSAELDAISTTHWYAMDLSQGLMPFVYQERVAPSFQEVTDPNSDHVFKNDEFLYGVRARGAVGPTFWPLITRVRPS